MKVLIMIMALLLSGCAVGFTAQPAQRSEVTRQEVATVTAKLGEDVNRLANALIAIDGRLKKLEPKKEPKK